MTVFEKIFPGTKVRKEKAAHRGRRRALGKARNYYR